jgi:hypothetical protein
MSDPRIVQFSTGFSVTRVPRVVGALVIVGLVIIGALVIVGLATRT